MKSFSETDWPDDRDLVLSALLAVCETQKVARMYGGGLPEGSALRLVRALLRKYLPSRKAEFELEPADKED